MSKIKSENYYVIHGWMLNNLNLSGTQLQVYAIIYGFSQDGNTSFSGSLSYLCDFTGAGRTTIVTALNKLVDKKLIEKNVTCTNGVRFVTYKVNLNAINCNGTPSTDSELPRTESELPSTKSVLGNHGGGSTKSVPNKESLSIDKEIYNDIYNISCSSSDEPKKTKSASLSDVEDLFERVWKLYPSKRGKGQVSLSKKKKLYSYGYEQIKRCVERYVKEIKEQGKEDYYQNGSTFFNSGYVDFLDENYCERPKSSGGGFSANKNQSKPSAGFGYRELD